jgi:hypothetical protein
VYAVLGASFGSLPFAALLSAEEGAAACEEMRGDEPMPLESSTGGVHIVSASVCSDSLNKIYFTTYFKGFSMLEGLQYALRASVYVKGIIML